MRPLQGFLWLAAVAVVLCGTQARFARGDDEKDKAKEVKSNNKGKIEGTKWSSLAATIKGNSLPAGSLKLEFKADGGFVYTVGPQVLPGKYTLGSGASVTLTLDKEIAGQKVLPETITIDGGKLKMSDADGTSMTFEKVP